MAPRLAPLAARHRWDLTPTEAVALQRELRAELVPRAPPAFAPRLAAGVDMSIARGSRRGYAGVAVVDLETLETVEEAGVAVDVSFPYIPGLLSFREMPAILAAWEKLSARPDVVIFDGAGYAHPRRFGLACHGGMVLGLPSVGCAKSILTGRHDELADERGATAALVDRGETVGMAVRTRPRVKPLYVSIGNEMDLDTAVALVLRLTSRYREPETTRRAHSLVNRLRREDKP